MLCWGLRRIESSRPGELQVPARGNCEISRVPERRRAKCRSWADREVDGCGADVRVVRVLRSCGWKTFDDLFHARVEVTAQFPAAEADHRPAVGLDGPVAGNVLATRTVGNDGGTIRFRHAGPRVMRWADRPAASAVQALRWLGPDAARDAPVVAALKRRLPEAAKRDLARNGRDLPGWALPLARDIAGEDVVAA